jgi:transglutaminase-like putative cysteine protease
MTALAPTRPVAAGRAGDVPRATRRLAAAASVACTLLACANLPADAVPPGWLAAFTAPAVLLALLQGRAARAWQRALLATTLQLCACWLALLYAGPLARPAALACTILPPLAFVTVRRRFADTPLGLFLSFCTLLVGVILDGVDPPLVGAWAAAACLSLRLECHVAAATASRRPTAPAPARGAPRLAASGVLLALPCLLVVVALERALAALPSPSRPRASASVGGTAEIRGVGLSDRFDLDRGGILSDLTGEQLIRVSQPLGGSVGQDLYLRSGFFAQPDLDRWQLGRLARARAADPELHVLRRPVAGAAVHWLEIERFDGARNFVFVPPGTCELRGVPDLLVDPEREWLRQREGAARTSYQLAWQDLPMPSDLPLEPRAERLGLLTLPADLERRPFEALLAEWQVTSHAATAAARITAGLGARCRYDRQDPSGPFAHQLENFLFAPGDRRGYCMHFASAAAILLRMAGVACRIGVGLYGGDADRVDARARIYGSQHAHAWVEIPFADRGYVVFDPTPPDLRGSRARDAARATGEAKPDAAADSTSWADAFARIGEALQQPWLLLAALGAALLAALWPGARGRNARSPAAAPPALRTARRLLAHILHALAGAGHARPHGHTLEQFASALASAQSLAPEVREAFACYQEVRFGGRAFDVAREAAMQRGLAAAKALPRLGPPS